MKIIAAIFLSFVTAVSIAQIPNPSFENWTAGNPNGWTDGNSIVPGTTTESNNAHAGTHACSLNSSGGIGGFVQTGTSFYDSYFHQPGNFIALNGWYILNSVSGEGIYVTVQNKAGNSSNGSGNYQSTISTAVYKQFSACMSGETATTDSTSISITLTGSPAHTGAYVIIDDLSFGPCVNAVDNIASDVTLEPSYPNPASTICNIIYSIPIPGNVCVSLYDLSGRKLETLLDGVKQTTGRYKIPVDVSRLANGIYIYTVTVDGKTYSQKLSVVR